MPLPTIDEAILAAYEREYRELADNWKQIDQKSYWLIAANGLLIAGCFGLVGKVSLSSFGRLALLLATIFLLISIAFCFLALRVRDASLPVEGDVAAEIAGKVRGDDALGDDGARTTAFWTAIRTEWQKVCAEIDGHNTTKAGQLEKARWCFAAAAVALALLILSLAA
jgi:hypothetical protein